MTTASSPDYVAGEVYGDASAARSGRRWLPAVVGVLSILIGTAALVWPGPTLLVVGVLFGAQLTLWGMWRLMAGIVGGETTGLRVLDVILGLIGVLAGLVLIVRPDASVATVALVLGFWWCMLGVTRIVCAIVPEGRWWNLIWGVVSLVAGIVILSSPEIALATLVLIVGIGLILQGCLELLLAFVGGEGIS